MKTIYRLVSLILAVSMVVLSFAACEKKPASSEAGGNASSSGGANKESYDMLFDGNEETVWEPNLEGTTTIEFSLDKEMSFNAISFVEKETNITDYIVEAKIDGEYKQIYRQDEMGRRESILDKTYTAKDIRLTVTMAKESGGIAEMIFNTKEKIEGTANFRNLGYYTASRLDNIRAAEFGEIQDVTDIILFDFGAWDKNGDFNWGAMGEEYDEEFMVECLAEIERELKGRKIDIWFSIQNYNKKTTNNTGELFATEASRKNLTEFCINLCKKYGFVGIDIDYEYPHSDEEYREVAWSNYDKFLAYFIPKMHAAGFKVSGAFYPKHIDLSKEVIESIDYINAMVYDYVIDNVGRHSSYAGLEKSRQYYLDLGFKPEQLVLGVPLHTKSLAEGEKAGGYNWVIKRWRGSIEPWMNMASTEQYTFYFNGGDMMRDKVWYAMNHGYSGVFNWCIGCDVGRDDYRSISAHIADTIERFKK